MTSADLGRSLIALINRTADAVTLAGGAPEVCVVHPLEMLAIIAAISELPEGLIDRIEGGLRIATAGGWVAVYAREDAPSGRLVVMSRKDFEQ